MSTVSTIHVVLHDNAGALTEIEVDPNATVLALKQKYSDLHTSITVGQQKMIISSSVPLQGSRIVLHDQNTLSSYNIDGVNLGSHADPILLFLFNRV